MLTETSPNYAAAAGADTALRLATEMLLSETTPAGWVARYILTQPDAALIATRLVEDFGEETFVDQETLGILWVLANPRTADGALMGLAGLTDKPSSSALATALLGWGWSADRIVDEAITADSTGFLEQNAASLRDLLNWLANPETAGSTSFVDMSHAYQMFLHEADGPLADDFTLGEVRNKCLNLLDPLACSICDPEHHDHMVVVMWAPDVWDLVPIVFTPENLFALSDWATPHQPGSADIEAAEAAVHQEALRRLADQDY